MTTDGDLGIHTSIMLAHGVRASMHALPSTQAAHLEVPVMQCTSTRASFSLPTQSAAVTTHRFSVAVQQSPCGTMAQERQPLT